MKSAFDKADVEEHIQKIESLHSAYQVLWWRWNVQRDYHLRQFGV